MSTLTVLRWLLAVALFADVAHAQPGDADRLFEEGRALAAAGDHGAACGKFAESYRLDPTAGTKLNLGDCTEHLGRLREALALFEEAAALFESQGETKRAAFARERARALVGRLVTVIVKVAEPTRAGLRIVIAGQEVAAASEIRTIADPGTISIVATVPERPAYATSVTSTGGATVTVEVPRFESVATQVNTPSTRRSRSRVHLSWGLAAGSVATGLTAGLLTLKARSDYDAVADGTHCTAVVGGITCDATGRAEIRDAQHLADIGTVFALTSAAVGVAALIVYMTAPSERIVVAPVATTNSASLVGSIVF